MICRFEWEYPVQTGVNMSQINRTWISNQYWSKEALPVRYVATWRSFVNLGWLILIADSSSLFKFLITHDCRWDFWMWTDTTIPCCLLLIRPLMKALSQQLHGVLSCLLPHQSNWSENLRWADILHKKTTTQN